MLAIKCVAAFNANERRVNVQTDHVATQAAITEIITNQPEGSQLCLNSGDPSARLTQWAQRVAKKIHYCFETRHLASNDRSMLFH